MKTVVKIIFGFSLCIVALTPAHAQDVHFSQFLYSPLTLNPAIAGEMQYDKRVSVNYRDQWRSVASPYKTVGFSFDMPVIPKGWKTNTLGVGLSFFNDRSGDLQMGTSQGMLTVSDHVWLDKFNLLSAGIQAGFGQRSIDYAGARWASQYDGQGYNPALASGENFSSGSSVYGDFAAGVKWSYSNNKGTALSSNDLFKARFGISYYHLNKPKQSFYGLQTEPLFPKFCVHGGMVMGTKVKELSFLPDFFYWDQGPSKQVVVGTLVRYAIISRDRRHVFTDNAALAMGLFWRNKDAWIISTQLEYDHYAIGISYDINASPLKVVSRYRGAFELSLRYTGINPFNNKKQAFFKANSI